MFIVCSVLPVWTAWYFSPWEGNGEQASFWTMLASVQHSARQIGLREMALDFYGPELVHLTLLLGVSIGVGCWLGRRLRIEAAAELAAAPDSVG